MGFSHYMRLLLPSFKAIIFVVIFVFCSLALYPQADDENLDDLFGEETEDIIIDNDVDTGNDLLDKLSTSEKIKIGGSFKARGGFAAGWQDLPDPDDLTDSLGISPGATTLAKLNFNAQPDPDFAVTGTFFTEIDPADGENEWSDPEIEELFCDYTWLDTIFFRIGKHKITWGQGRLFTPGNLMDDSGDGTAFRASFPTLLDGVTLVSLIDDSYVSSDESLSASDTAAGMLVDKVIGNVFFSAGGKYRKADGLDLLGSVKTVLWKMDLLSDFVLHNDDNDITYESVSGFFREWSDFKLYGEYYYDGSVIGDEDHSIGLASAYKNIFDTPIDLGLEWKHSFVSEAGSLIAGASWSPWKFVKANIGIPFVYGSSDSDYMDDNEAPGNRRLSFVFFLELSASF